MTKMRESFALNPLVQAVEAPPIAEACRWAAAARRPLLDTAQAVPTYPPAAELRRHMAEALEHNEPHLYTEILGLAALREALAEHMSEAYEGRISPDQVAVTAGCNQAFCLVMTALAQAGDEVILPVPYYFNHQMWLEMQGIRARHLPCRAAAGLIPDPEEARGLITPRCRAIVLVSPNNPTGAVYPPEVIARFLALARERGIALVIDETYKDFLAAGGAPHRLFQDPDWPENLIQLYSFSKAYCLTGHRVGSIIAAPKLLEAVEKIADCVTICPPHLGQIGALFALGHLGAWRDDKLRIMTERLSTLRSLFEANDLGYELISAGAYFAYLRHPFEGESAAKVARRLAQDFGLLCLPGSIFGPEQEAYLRLAFANLEAEKMPEMAGRLRESREARTGAAL